MIAGLVIGGQNNGVSEVRSIQQPQTPQYLLAMRRVSPTRQVDEPQLATPTPLRGSVAALPPAEALSVVEPPVLNSIEGIICSFNWPQGCDYWIAIAACESSLSPNAPGYMGSYVGLFQVWLGHGYGYTWLLNPLNNTQAAWELSDEGTYTGAWPYCQWQ